MDFSNKFLKRFSKEKKEALVVELRKLFDDYDFVYGTLCALENDADIDKVLAFIKENENQMSTNELYEEVIFFTLDIHDEYKRRNGIKYEWDPD